MTEAQEGTGGRVADGQDVARPGPGPQERDRAAPRAEIGGREAGQRIQAPPDRAERPHPRTGTDARDGHQQRQGPARTGGTPDVGGEEAGLSETASPGAGAESAPPVQGEVARVDARTVSSRSPSVPMTASSVGHELFLYRTQPRAEYLGKATVISTDPDQVRDPRHRLDRPEQESKGGGHCLVYDPPEGLAVRGPPPRAGGGRPGVFVQAPPSDIYVAMLGVCAGGHGPGLPAPVPGLQPLRVQDDRLGRPSPRHVALAAVSENSVLYTCNPTPELLQSHRPLELATLPSFGRTVVRRLLLKPCHVTCAFRSGEHGSSRPAT